MATTLWHHLLRLAPVDRAIAFTLLNRVWMLASNVLTMLLVVHFFSAEQQGLYFTFLTLLGLHAVFDLGLSFTATQWTARAGAGLEDAHGAARVADGPARTRLALLAACAARQAAWLAAVFLVFSLCLGIWLFANDPRVAREQWLAPWILAAACTSLRIPLLALEGVLEGLGKVGFVAQVRLAGLVTGTLALWAIVAGGAGLYGIAASCALALAVPALAYGRRYGPLLLGLRGAGAGAGHPFSWRREVWPFQWRYAATVLASFLVANLFNPALYYYRGAGEAGRFGLGMSIAQAVAGLMSVWLNSRVPRIARLTAERRFDELALLFRSVKRSTVVVALLAGTAAMVFVRLLALVDPALGARLPPTVTLLVLLVAAVLQQYILTVAVFARAQAREPLLVPSLLAACATPCLLAWLVPGHGALGAAAGYLLPVLFVALPFCHVANRQVGATLAGQDASAPGLPRLRRFVRSLRGLYALRYWPRHLELTRLLAHPGLIGLTRRRPRVLFKYLHRNYLAVGLDSACRLEILVHHYGCLVRALPVALLRTLLLDGLVVWRLPGGANAVSITLSFPRHDFEGELMLELRVGGMPIYSLTATLAPGRAVHAGSGPVVLITCLQGGADRLPLIRQATRACANTPPPYLLLAAAEGVAAAFRLELIVAVGNSRQLAKAAGAARFDYDHFWACLGGVQADGFYHFPPRLPEKPLRAFPSRHRSRQVRKNELKRRIAESVRRCLIPSLHREVSHV